MAGHDVSPEVRRFIAEHLDSVEQLEILLLLRGRAPRAVTAQEVTRELRLGGGSADLRLRELQDRGLVAADGAAFRYAPRTSTQAAGSEAVARLFADRKVTVIELIYSAPSRELRSFADAFKFRKG